MFRRAICLAAIAGLFGCSSAKYADERVVMVPVAAEEPPPAPPPPPPPPPPPRPILTPAPAPAIRTGSAVIGNGQTTVYGYQTTGTGDGQRRYLANEYVGQSTSPVTVGRNSRRSDAATALDADPPANPTTALDGAPANPSDDLLAGLPAYSPWPPEKASSRIDLDFLIGARDNLSLYEAGQRLKSALREADYGQHSFYSVPGGFILVTDTEQIRPQGTGYQGAKRYQMPGEGRDSWWLIIRDLFLERPDTFYRYLAIVVTDRPFSAIGKELTRDEAVERLQMGSTDLTRETRQIAFTDYHSVTALIYEFTNGGADKKLEMISPGRLKPDLHLTASGLDRTLPKAFPLAPYSIQGVGQ